MVWWTLDHAPSCFGRISSGPRSDERLPWLDKADHKVRYTLSLVYPETLHSTRT